MKDNKFSSGNEQFEALCKSDPKICQALLSLDPVRAYSFKHAAWVGWHARIADFDRVTDERDAAIKRADDLGQQLINFKHGMESGRSRLGTLLESLAKQVYDSWQTQPGWQPWQDGMASEKQNEARQIASRTFELALANQVGD